MLIHVAIAPVVLIIFIFVLLGQIATPKVAWARWFILSLAIVVVARYLPWRLYETVLSADATTFAGIWVWALFLVECVYIADLLKILLLRCRIADRSAEADMNQGQLEMRPIAEWPSVDVFIPTYNEPLDVLERSIVGTLNLDYPNFTVNVLDDGDRPWVRDFCAEQGANYICRTEHKHAKAGNLNHALLEVSGDLIAVFDADFVPYSWFLKRTVGFFNDPTIGILQTPQHFFNRDPVQRNLWIADRWPDEQRMFFDHLAPCLDAWDSMFCCGSCAVLRRRAVDQIGGIPTQSITEDILTTLEMLRAGFKTRYLNERLSVGLAAESLEAFYVQRERWCQGGIQTLFLQSGPLLGSGMTILQRILLFPVFWVFHIPARLLVLLIPVFYFGFGLEPLQNVRGLDLLFWQIPLLALGWSSSLFYLGLNGMPILNDGAAILVSLRLTPTVVSSLIKPFGQPFKVTPKGSLTGGAGVSYSEAAVIAVLMAASLVGLWFNISSDTRIIEDDSFLVAGAIWTAFNMTTLTIAFLICFENPTRDPNDRFPISTRAMIRNANGEKSNVIIEDLSLTGASLTCIGESYVAKGDVITLDIQNSGEYTSRVVRVGDGEIGIGFDPKPNGTARCQLINLLYTTGIDNAAKPGETLSLLQGLANRLWGEQR